MAVMIAETIPDTSREPSSERRIVGCALRSWEELRTGESFPLHGECLASFDRRLQPGVILIEINDHVENDIILDCGPDLIDALGRDPIGDVQGRADQRSDHESDLDAHGQPRLLRGVRCSEGTEVQSTKSCLRLQFFVAVLLFQAAAAAASPS